jgi:8-oxo-dGTP pyrophosphatase MutT (NUDIX family)
LTLLEFQKKLNSKARLPGNEAFKLLGLQRQEPSETELSAARKAAVSIIFSEVNKVPSILFIKRSNYKGVHSSQMAFPGGKLENDDASMLHCATRETLEEIGLDLTSLQPTLPLSPIFIPPSNFIVQPFVFFAPSFDHHSLALQKEEVQSLHFLDARILMQSSPFESTEMELSLGKIKTKGIYLDNEFIWGASAAMLAELHHIFNQ